MSLKISIHEYIVASQHWLAETGHMTKSTSSWSEEISKLYLFKEFVK